MENPWHEYFARKNKSKFHPKDEASAFAFNKTISSGKNSEKHKLREDLEPLPYLGNPSAPVLVLLANPGAGGSGEEKNIPFTGKKLELHQRNLMHQQQIDDYILKFNSPDDNFLESPYFKAHTKQLIEATSVKSVATKIFFVNFHGYQSKSWYPIPFTFYTQVYTFELVKKAVFNGALIIMSRNKIGWFTAVPELTRYSNISTFISPRKVHLSEKNLKPKVFQKIIDLME